MVHFYYRAIIAIAGNRGSNIPGGCAAIRDKKYEKESFHMVNSTFGKDKIKRIIYLIFIFGGFAILHNFVPNGLDQAGWDGFLVLFVTVFLWLTEAVPMAVTAIFALFFGAGSVLKRRA